MKIKDIENLATEGATGVRDLCKLAQELGYTDPLNNQYGELILLLEDNPMLIEAIYQRIISAAYLFDEIEDED